MSSRNSEATKTRILQAAWALLEGDDPAKSRMGDIAKQAGISRQALYLHYPTRAELLVATARHIDAVKDVEARLAPSRAAETGVTRLSEYIRFWCDYLPEIAGVARAFITMMDADDAARAAWQDRMQALYEGCHAAIADLQRDGALQGQWTITSGADWLAAQLSYHNWDFLVRDKGWSQAEYMECLMRTAQQALVRKAG